MAECENVTVLSSAFPPVKCRNSQGMIVLSIEGKGFDELFQYVNALFLSQEAVMHCALSVLSLHVHVSDVFISLHSLMTPLHCGSPDQSCSRYFHEGFNPPQIQGCLNSVLLLWVS